MSTTIELDAEIMDLVSRLPLDQKRRVLGYVEGLLDGGKPLGTLPSAWAHLRGTLSREAGEEMKRIIEEDCERIDPESP